MKRLFKMAVLLTAFTTTACHGQAVKNDDTQRSTVMPKVQGVERSTSYPTSYDECIETMSSEGAEANLEETQRLIWRCREEFKPD